jgi:Fe-S-cluster containining protein
VCLVSTLLVRVAVACPREEAHTDQNRRMIPQRPVDSVNDLPAGPFASWLSGMERALRGEGISDVPCGTCTACCTSSQFVHVGPDETDTLAHVPRRLLFPAPGLPQGHAVLGYDEHGHCPMLREGRCSIYEHRPRTCRTYDCRIFPAAGVTPDHDAIAQRARRWQFMLDTDDDRIRLDALRAAARYAREHGDELPASVVPTTATQVAVTAVEIHEHFLDDAARTEATRDRRRSTP